MRLAPEEWDWDQYYIRPFDLEGEMEDKWERDKILAEAEGIPEFEDEEDEDDFPFGEDLDEEEDEDWDDWDEDDDEGWD